MAKEPKFKTGDSVRLKSGGPTMTVKEYDFLSLVECQWFSGNKLQEGTFREDALEVAPKEDPKSKAKS